MSNERSEDTYVFYLPAQVSFEVKADSEAEACQIAQAAFKELDGHTIEFPSPDGTQNGVIEMSIDSHLP